MELEMFNNGKEGRMSSREIAEITGKRHDHVLRDCDKLNENYEKLGLPKIGEGYFTTPNTGETKYREFLLNKIQSMDLMTGYNVELRIKVNRRLKIADNVKRLAVRCGNSSTNFKIKDK